MMKYDSDKGNHKCLNRLDPSSKGNVKVVNDNGIMPGTYKSGGTIGTPTTHKTQDEGGGHARGYVNFKK